MAVSGVRRSWETARSRFARTFSFSFSARMRSCFLMFVVSVLVITATKSMAIPENTFSGAEKLSSKYGKVKAKLTASTPASDAAIPYR